MADGGASQIIVTPPKGRAKRLRVADLFCGAGGTSTGIMRAIRQLLLEQGLGAEGYERQVDLVAVNHWPTAIETHKRNHPVHAERTHCADLESARPRELVPEGMLDLLCASPTCTYHSRARGGRPIYDQMRMDPWHVVRWCTELRVHRLLIENVPEFLDWGPCDLRTGRPIKSRKGEYFRAWCDALRSVGFRLDYRVLNCADYGDVTTRQRFFMIGASDGRPLRWPEPTHSRDGGVDLLSSLQRWRPAAEIIDWSIQGRSIFARKKPLAPNTLRRILAGAVRYGWPQPYIDAIQALLDGREPVLDIPFLDATQWVADCAAAGMTAPVGGDGFLVHLRGTSAAHIDSSAHGTEQPLPTLTAGGTHVGLVMATGAGGAAREVSQPIPTLTAGGNGPRPHFIRPIIMGVGSNNAARDAGADPLPTITTGGASAARHPGNARPQLIEPLLAPYYGGGSGLTAQTTATPVPSITTKARFGVAEPVLIRTDQTGSGATGMRSQGDPLHTLVSKANTGLAEPFLLPVTHQGDQRVYGLDEPLRTITGANRGELGITEPAVAGYRIDILYRMLHWRELARATSFDDEGEEYQFAGNATEITKQIGNAVPGRMAKALGYELLRYRL